MHLVNIKDYHIRGKLYYVQPNNLTKYNISTEDLEGIGIFNDDVFVAEEVAIKLEGINKTLNTEGFELVIKDGYRSSKLYELVYEKRCKIFGKEETDKILNMDRKIHATGYAVDVSIALIGKDDIPTKFGSHGDKARYGQEQYDLNFFKDSLDPEEIQMHNNRMKLYDLMTEQGFILGTLNEYWHYELPLK